MITPKTVQYVTFGVVKFPARTEKQIKDAISKIRKEAECEGAAGTWPLDDLLEELGLE